MARKGKNKKKRNTRNYSKKKFRNVICSVCGLCVYKTDPSFCYSSMYKASPEVFINRVYPNLVDLSEWKRSCGYPNSTISKTNFSFVFCETGVCNKGKPLNVGDCPSSGDCFSCFKTQIEPGEEGPVFSVYKGGNRKKKKNKRKKARQVYDPYPTFFSRKNEEFESFVRKILHGDNDNKQNSDQKLSTSDSGTVDRDAESGESKVHRGSGKG